MWCVYITCGHTRVKLDMLQVRENIIYGQLNDDVNDLSTDNTKTKTMYFVL